MDRNTYEILLRFRDNPVVRDNPLDDGLTPDEESLVKAGLLDKHVINRKVGTYSVAISQKGRDALEARTFWGRIKQILRFFLTPLGAAVNTIVSTLVGYLLAKLFGQ